MHNELLKTDFCSCETTPATFLDLVFECSKIDSCLLPRSLASSVIDGLVYQCTSSAHYYGNLFCFANLHGKLYMF